jgi:hypothetical protein
VLLLVLLRGINGSPILLLLLLLLLLYGRCVLLLL